MPEYRIQLEEKLQKIVSMTEMVKTTEEHTVNWEDMLSELEASTGKGRHVQCRSLHQRYYASYSGTGRSYRAVRGFRQDR